MGRENGTFEAAERGIGRTLDVPLLGRPRRTGNGRTPTYVIAELLAEGRYSPMEIAEIVGCDRRQVAKVAGLMGRADAYRAQAARIVELEQQVSALRDLVMRRLGAPADRLDRLHARARLMATDLGGRPV